MKLYPYQEEAVEQIKERRSLLVAYEMGLGKAVTLSSRVLTPSGWSPASDIREGDWLIGRDGRPTKVLGVYPQPIKEIYRVTFRDGAHADVCGEHLWAAQRPSDTHRDPDKWSVLSTEELLAAGLVDAAGNSRWRIPMLTAPVQYLPVSLAVDPYLLGVVLGDGTSSGGGRYTISSDEEILVALGARNIRLRKGCFYRHSGIVEVPAVLGLEGLRAWEKKVPEQYLRAAPEDRLALLQGLLDTDGYPMYRGGVEFCSTSENLVDAVIDLVEGLGGVARNKTLRTTSYTHRGERRQGRPSWRVNVKMPEGMEPFRLVRKRERWVPPVKYRPVRVIQSIEPIGPDHSVCFRVDAEDSLFVIDRHVVTHNTPLTITALESMMDDEVVTSTVLVVVLASLKYQWEKEIERWAPKSSSVVITGSPDARRKKYQSLLDGEPVDYVIANYDLVVRDYAEFFGKVRWGAVVCDEATAIKSFRSKRSKVIKGLAKRSPVRIALTGTPISNGKPEELFSMMEFVDPSVLGDFQLFDKAFIVRNRSGWVERYRNLPTLHKTLAPAMARKRQADDDVAPYLPEVVDADPELVEMDRGTSGLYQHIARDLLRVLDEAEEMFGSSWSFSVAAHYGHGEQVSEQEVAMRGEIMSRIQALRMLCSHPAALRTSADRFAEQMDGHGTRGSSYAYLLKEMGLLDTRMGAPKLEAVVQRAKDFLDIDPEYKLVVFSSFLDVIPLLSEELAQYGPRMFHGALSDKAREAAKTAFQNEADARILISSDAGGYGVDLPQGNLLINYDLPWTNSDALQRNSRIIRASSRWSSVRVERYIIRDSIEERQWEALNHKKDVSGAILDGSATDARGGVLSTVSSLRDALSNVVVKV